MSTRLEDLKSALAGSYEIDREIGQGGMANVYLARDTKHNRNVAVKVLRPELATALGPDRFLREIEIAANLMHPHILPLYDSGEADGFLYYVMPFVKGDTLRQRIEKEGELPVAEAVRIIREVVDALAFAHSQGVVHRDIKPDNVMISGRHALVTDFGVAKAVSEATGKNQLTTAGVALGTPAYMSPEQATADPHIDHRADIYAIGAMAYELLTGRPPFIGHTPQAVLAAHVTEQVEPVSKHRDQVSAQLEAVVMKCLAKKPADRWQAAEEMLPHLELLATSSGGLTPAATMPIAAVPTHTNWTRVGTVAAAVVGLSVIGWLGKGLLEDKPLQITVLRNTQLTRTGAISLDPAISPDGREVAFVAGPAGAEHLFLQDTEGRAAVNLVPELEGSQRNPLWSLDGRDVMFTSIADGGQTISSVSRSGGPVRTTLPGSRTSLVALTPDSVTAVAISGRLLVRSLIANADSVIYVVSDSIGGQAHSPSVSPDGRLVTYVSGNSFWVQNGNVAPSTIMVVRMEEGNLEEIEVDGRRYPKWDGRPVAVSDSTNLNVSPVWLPDSRHILYISDRAGSRDIYLQRLNSRGEANAPPVRITAADAHSISISRDGRTVAYSKFSLTRNLWSLPIPGSGSVSISEAVPFTRGSQVIETSSGRPGGEWVAFDADIEGNFDIYRQRVAGDEPVQVTRDPGDDFFPNWSPDGREIVFHSTRTGNREVFVISAFDGSPAVQITTNPGSDQNASWGPDGNSLAFNSTRDGVQGVYLVRRDTLTGEWGTPELLARGGNAPVWSPDGNWIARGNSFGPGSVMAVTDLNGVSRDLFLPSAGFSVIFSPHWSADGRTVYFRALDPEGQSGIWSVPFAGGAPAPAVVFDDPSKQTGSIWTHFGTDGESFYITVGRIESDIWVMELEY